MSTTQTFFQKKDDFVNVFMTCTKWATFSLETMRADLTPLPLPTQYGQPPSSFISFFWTPTFDIFLTNIAPVKYGIKTKIKQWENAISSRLVDYNTTLHGFCNKEHSYKQHWDQISFEIITILGIKSSSKKN